MEMEKYLMIYYRDNVDNFDGIGFFKDWDEVSVFIDSYEDYIWDITLGKTYEIEILKGVVDFYYENNLHMDHVLPFITKQKEI